MLNTAIIRQGLPRRLQGKESACQRRRCRRPGFDPWVWRSPRGVRPTPVFLPEKLHGQRSLVGCGPRGLKESDTTEHARIITGELVLTSRVIQHINNRAVQDFLPVRTCPCWLLWAISEVAAVLSKSPELTLLWRVRQILLGSKVCKCKPLLCHRR